MRIRWASGCNGKEDQTSGGADRCLHRNNYIRLETARGMDLTTQSNAEREAFMRADGRDIKENLKKKNTKKKAKRINKEKDRKTK